MSPSDTAAPVSLRAQAEDGVVVTVCDGKYKPLKSGAGVVQLDVPPGLYLVRYAAGSNVEQQVVEVRADTPVEVNGPSLKVSAPVPIAENRFSFHQDEAAKLSQEVHFTAGRGSEIFLFVRDRDRRGRATPLRGMTLHDVDGRLVADLQQEGVFATDSRDEAPPFAGLTLRLDPGPYLLRGRAGGVGAFEQMIYAIEGWQTQVFAERVPGRGERGRVAWVADAAVLMARLGHGFDPGREDLRLTELARQALGTQRPQVVPVDVQQMPWMKWNNPMLGLYTAHILMRQAERDNHLISEIARNLRTMLPHHPDVQALGLMLEHPERQVFPLPPMLRASWDLIVRATARAPHVVPVPSMSATIAESTFAGTMWLVWRRGHKAVAEHARPSSSVEGRPGRRHPNPLKRARRPLLLREPFEPGSVRQPAPPAAAPASDTPLGELVQAVAQSAPAMPGQAAHLDDRERSLVLLAAMSAEEAEGEQGDVFVESLRLPLGVVRQRLVELAQRLKEE